MLAGSFPQADSITYVVAALGDERHTVGTVVTLRELSESALRPYVSLALASVAQAFGVRKQVLDPLPPNCVLGTGPLQSVAAEPTRIS